MSQSTKQQLRGYHFFCNHCDKGYLVRNPTKLIHDGYFKPTISLPKKYDIGFTCPLGHFHWVAQTHSEKPLHKYSY